LAFALIACRVGGCRTTLTHEGAESEDRQRSNAYHDEQIHQTQLVKRTTEEERCQQAACQ
jgi:hypothetical protein